MKKLFLITLVDGNEYRIELGEPRDKIIRALNHPEHLGAAINIARSGFCVDPKATMPRIIAPAMIKTVDIILDKD